ncbi:exodeoxyribonuclease VII large subunit [Granulicella sp. WH15]|nr:exodeoxyribonuclease VII large subunit [Granulicella sp. WH15]
MEAASPPTEAAAPDPEPVPIVRESSPLTYTVRELIASVRRHLEEGFHGLISVEGEVSNCRPAASGHVYFTLKDGEAQLPIVLFRRQAQLLRFRIKDGQAVKVRGRIALYESRGQLQLIAETVEEQGTGALQRAFEELRARLLAEGLFDRPKRPLPAFPKCIGIVTSPSGAVIRDIVNVVRRRHSRLNLLVYPAIMQGTNCARTVAAGVSWFNQHPERVDLILIARGGGSMEDLAGFNDEALARTIAASELPVVSAIGHETDTTISDFVADLRAPTPSAAAELITAAQHRIEERVISLERRVHRAGQYQLMSARQRLARLSADQVLRRLRDSIGRREQRVDELRFRLMASSDRMVRSHTVRLATLEARLRRHDPTVRLAAATHRLQVVSERLNRLATELPRSRRVQLATATARLSALSPLSVLQRGYAIVYAEDGSILRDAADTAPAQQIRARLARGSVRAQVTQIQATEIPATENQ